MTKYEKFLKGEILPYKRQILETYRGYDKYIYKYRISKYGTKFYILIMKCNYNATPPGIFHWVKNPSGYTYKKIEGWKRWRLGPMLSYFVLEKRSLKTLRRFLKYPGMYIQQNLGRKNS